jgi:hypothetical protein
MKKLIVILAAIAMVGSFTATAMADVDLYGSARFRTYYATVDSGAPGVDSDSDLEWRMGHLTRFGANFKSDKITGKFEMDARAGGGANPGTANLEASGGASGIGNMRLRQLWGQYDFGAGKLMIGQNYPLFDAPVSGINYYSGGFQPLGGIGITDARTSQIRLTFGDFRLAFLQADTTNLGLAPMTEVNTMFPKIEVRYDMKMDAFALNFIGGYQSYEIEDYNYVTGAGTRQSEDITSWVLGARGKANFGPAYVGLSLNYRQNGDNYGAWTASTKELATFEGSSIKDATGFGFVAAVGYKVNDMFTLEASYGSLSTEQDTALDNEDDANVWGLMAKITVAPGVYIIPEFIMQDNKDVVNDGVSTEQGDATIFGVFWMINFK